MVSTDPLWLPGLPYDETEFRKMDALLTMATSTAGMGRGGVRPGEAGLTVSLAGTTVNVSGGPAFLTRSGQGTYRAQLAATSPGTLAAAHATLARIDLVYLRVWDNTVDSSGLSKADTFLLTGTPAGSPAAPTPGANEIYTPLATITVPSAAAGGTGAATVSTAARQVTVAPGGILPVSSAADIALAGLYAGQARYNTVRSVLEFWTGSAWQAQGDWAAYTPTWGGGLATAGSSVSKGRWTRIGNRVEVTGTLKWGSGSTMNSSNITATLPTTAASGVALTDIVWQGQGYYWDGANPFKPLQPIVSSAATTAFLYAIRQSDLGYQSPGSLGYGWGSGALMTFQLSYEAP